jgi:NAD(P)H-hydrate epimerase
MEVISSLDMQILDLNCEYFGLSRLQLMENAGSAIADEIKKRFSDVSVAIFAGPGNNGGDGFVAARHLKGFDVSIYLLCRKSDVKTEIARKNLEVLIRSGINVTEISKPPEIDADVVIDAMLGTGVRGELREPYSSVVDAINDSKSFVVAIDVPTGVDPDSGKYSKAVKADLTVTFHKPKPGILRAKKVVGEVVVRDIGIPDEFERVCGVGDAVAVYKRWRDGHKGDHGRVLVVGGGEYSGAPALASLAAYAAGADIVTTVVPEAIKKVVASFSPNLIVRGVGSNQIELKNLNEVLNIAKKHDVIVAGMGVGKNDEFRDFVSELLKEVKKAVLDAEGIVEEIPEIECIMTPHRGEFKRHFGEPDEEGAKKVAAKLGCVILMKGQIDIITDGIRLKRNETGNAGMTVGGTGDVLAGICGALLCNNDAFHAACGAAFINGFAGDMCFERYGYNFTSTQLIEEIPIAFKRCLEWR